MRACSRARTPMMTWSIPAVPLRIAFSTELPSDLATDTPSAQRRVVAPAAGLARLIHDGDQLDLDHRSGLRQAADLDRRAGRAGDTEIAHADVAALGEFGIIGDE